VKIIFINPKTDFTKQQIRLLSDLGEVIFINSLNELSDQLISDQTEKIIAVGPDSVDWKFPNETIDKVINLKAVCVPTTSFSWVDGKFLRNKGIDLINVPKYSTESVAEYAICLMLNLVKKIPLVIKNNWKIDYTRHQGWEIKGKTVGIIGLGSIGKRIAELTKFIGMNVIYWSKNSRDDRFEYKDFDDVLKTADFIFPTLAKNDETKTIINKDKLDLIKPESFIVSITGDDLFDLNYASEMVKNNKLSGLAFESDKYSINNLDQNNFEGNILVTPPIAWFTKEAFMEDMRIWVENIGSKVKGNPVNIVN
jgi:lactate dehydrogenase-like 2-hydroxyacid dehydrogenase